MLKIFILAISLLLFINANSLIAVVPSHPNPFKDQFQEKWKQPHDPFIIHTIPKCGVHQLQRLVQLIVPEDIACSGCRELLTEEFYKKQLIMRTHESYSEKAMGCVRAAHYKMVAIVRDPRDALISHLHYMRLFGEKPNAPLQRDFFSVGADFDSLPMNEQIKVLITGNDSTPSYIRYYQKRLGFALCGYPLVVKYEHLQPSKTNHRLEKTVKKIANYLHVQLSEDHLAFILKNSYDNQVPYAGIMPPKDGKDMMGGIVYKRASTGNWKLFLNEEHKDILKALIGEDLIRLGYEKDYSW